MCTFYDKRETRKWLIMKSGSISTNKCLGSGEKKIWSPGELETRNSSWPYRHDRQHTCTIKVNNLLFCSDDNDVLQVGPIFNVFSSVGYAQFTLLHVVHLYVLTIEKKYTFDIIWIGLISCLMSQSRIFQLYLWRHIDTQVNWRSWTYVWAPTL